MYLNGHEGLQTIYPTVENISLAGNSKKIQVLRLLGPDSINLNIEKLETKSVKIEPSINLKPQNGYTIVGEIKIEPEEALIRAPQSIVDSVQVLNTEVLELENIKYPVKRQISLNDPLIEHLDLLTTKVSVTADIQKLMEKKISNIPVNVINLPRDVTALVIPSNLSLIVQGGVNVVFPLNETDIDVYIDYKRHRSNQKQDFPAYIRPIPGIRFTNVEPQRFKIILKRD